MPRFSIIIPAHNAEKYIQKALGSVTQQTFKDYELIVPCDACTDNTKALAEAAGAKTIEVCNHRDGLTRNAGLDMAKGEYVLFMDDDDWLLHEFVLAQIDKKLKQEGNPDLLCFSFIWKGIIYAEPLSNMGQLFPSVWNKCWRREWIGETRFTDIYSISDSYFHKAMMAKPHSEVIWDMPMYYYNYLRKGSISDEMGRTYEQTRRYWETH